MTTSVKTLQRLHRLKATLDRLGVSRLSPVRAVLRVVRGAALRRWDLESSEPTRIELHGIAMVIPRRYLPDLVLRDYEPLTTAAFRKAVRPGGTVLDVGAHLGYYTLLAGKLAGPSGRVHSVEPCPENRVFLEENLRLNRLDNVVLHPLAAGGRCAERSLQITASSDSHGFYPHPLARTVETATVPEAPLDEIITGPIDVAKIDVEGAEFEVLAGMRRLLRESPSLEIGVEWAPACLVSAGQDPASLPGLLQGLGFAEIRVLDDRDRQIRPLSDVLARVQAKTLPENWYVNLWARRRR